MRNPERFQVVEGDAVVATAATLSDAEFAARTLVTEGGYVALNIYDGMRPDYISLATVSMVDTPHGVRLDVRTGTHARYAR